MKPDSDRPRAAPHQPPDAARASDGESLRPRPYTDQEARDVVAVAKRRKTPSCPIDGTEMDVQLQRSLGRTSNVIVRCPRCEGRVQFVRAHG